MRQLLGLAYSENGAGALSGVSHLDGVLRQHAAVQLHRGQAQVLRNVRVLDLHDVVKGPPLYPLGGEAAAGDRGSAPERLEARVYDVPVVVDLRSFRSVPPQERREGARQPKAKAGHGRPRSGGAGKTGGVGTGVGAAPARTLI